MTHELAEIREHFLAALERVGLAAQLQYAAEHCSAMPEIRAKLEDMLQAHHQPDGFLASRGDASPTIELPVTERPGDTIGPYKLREQIGEGGMGIVYVAEQTEPVRRKVALKIIKPGMASRNVVARFEAERQALAMMNHPNIAKVFDAGATQSGQPYFVMELVHGPPINDYCDLINLATRERLELFAKICRAVQHAHEKGIIHRDLKPSNVLVPKIDGVPIPKVIDFGVAKAVDQKLTEQTVYTQFAQLIGTPLYMSPEQAEFGVVDIDTRSDVYSLGVLLYELLTGSTPFDSDTLKRAGFDEMRRIIREDEPLKPSAFVSTLKADALSTVSNHRGIDPRKLTGSLKGELDWIVMKCLEKDRHRRYASAKDLADDIERYLHDKPVLARPTSTIYRIRKFTRRNRVLVASVAAVLVALSLGLVSTTAALFHAIKQQDIAEQRLADVTREQEDNEVLIQELDRLYVPPRGTEARHEALTIRETVEEISADLETRLRDHPRVEIEIRKVLARHLIQNEQFDGAMEHLEPALELAKQEYGPEHEEVADILTYMAHRLQFSSMPETLSAETERYAKTAVDIYEQRDIKTELTDDAVFLLGYALRWNYDKAHEARAWLERHLRMQRERAQGKDTEDMCYALFDLAICIAESPQGYLEEEHVIDLARKSAEMSRRIHGDQPSLLAYFIRCQGVCFISLGKRPQAIECFRESWDIYKQHDLQREPAGHQIALTLAELYVAEQRYGEAYEILDEVAAICGSDPQLAEPLAKCHLVRGWGESLRGDYAAARNQFQESLEMAKEIEDLNMGAWSLFHLAMTFEATQDSAEAQHQRQQLFPIADSFVEMAPTNPLALLGRAWGLLRSGQGESARAAREDAIKAIQYGDNRSRYLRLPHGYLVKALAEDELDDREKAIETLRTALDEIDFESLVTASYEAPSTRRELELALARFLVEEGRPDKAIEVFEEGISYRKEHYDDKDNLKVALAELRYGEFLVEHGEFDDAEQPLLTASEKLSRNLAAAPVTAKRAAEQLIRAYEETNRTDEADQWQRKLTEMNATLDKNEEH